MNEYIAGHVDEMRAVGIYAILVKGQGVALSYEKSLWRSSGDVDLLLSKDNYEKAKAFILPRCVLTEPNEADKKNLAMQIGQWAVELHGTLHVGLSGRMDRILDKVQEAIFYGGQVRSVIFNANVDLGANLKRNARRIKAFIIESGIFGHNRDMSYYGKYPYVIRKAFSMFRRIGDWVNHARIFPVNSVRFFFGIMYNGVRSAIRGE